MRVKFLVCLGILLFALGAGAYIVFEKPYLQTGNHHKNATKTNADINMAREKYIKMANENDPKTALQALREEINSDDLLAEKCHGIAHAIGHEAYEKYKDFGVSASFQDEICNSGFIHGIIESHFTQSKDIYTEMNSICEKYEKGKFTSWQCYHGVGHGLMYFTENNLPMSLEYCDMYSDTATAITCANGVFMENFNTQDKLHPSEYLDPNDFTYPCGLQKDYHKSDCYLYSPTYYLSKNKKDYKGAIKSCEEMAMPYDIACIQGVGSQANKENVNNPQLVEKICMSVSKESQEACINGMVGNLIFHYGEVEKPMEVCNLLNDKNKEICLTKVDSFKNFF